MSNDNWKAQMDASTLAEAEAIKKDPSRMNAASSAAKSMAKEQAARLEGLKKVAGGNSKPLSASSPSNTSKPGNFWRSR